MDKDLKRYFEEAKRWDEDRLASALRSRRRAWVVAGAAMLLAVSSTTAVAMLTPLKTTEPFVIRVDRSTGVVDRVSALEDTSGPIRHEEAVSRYFLAQYVRLRQGYLDAMAAEAYRRVALMSGPTERGRWADHYRGSNPESPQNVHGPQAEVTVSIRAISFINDQVASVRFSTVEKRGPETRASDWIATLSFAYSRAPMAESDRLLNPLGFQVLSYRVDPEVVR